MDMVIWIRDDFRDDGRTSAQYMLILRCCIEVNSFSHLERLLATSLCIRRRYEYQGSRVARAKIFFRIRIRIRFRLLKKSTSSIFLVRRGSFKAMFAATREQDLVCRFAYLVARFFLPLIAPDGRLK